MLFIGRDGVSNEFSACLVSGYAHVFILLFVVTLYFELMKKSNYVLMCRVAHKWLTFFVRLKVIKF